MCEYSWGLLSLQLIEVALDDMPLGMSKRNEESPFETIWLRITRKKRHIATVHSRVKRTLNWKMMPLFTNQSILSASCINIHTIDKAIVHNEFLLWSGCERMDEQIRHRSASNDLGILKTTHEQKSTKSHHQMITVANTREWKMKQNYHFGVRSKVE